MGIEIFYQPNFPEYFRVVRRIAMKRFRLVAVILLVMPLMLVLFTVTEPQRADRPAPSHSPELWGSLLIPVGFVLLMYASIYYSARKQWTRAPEMREPRQIIITEQGLDVKGETFSGRNEWVNIAGGEQYRNLYLLRTRQGQYYLIPKQSFSGDDQLQEFLSLARRKLGRSFRG